MKWNEQGGAKSEADKLDVFPGYFTIHIVLGVLLTAATYGSYYWYKSHASAHSERERLGKESATTDPDDNSNGTHSRPNSPAASTVGAVANGNRGIWSHITSGWSRIKSLISIKRARSTNDRHQLGNLPPDSSVLSPSHPGNPQAVSMV